MPMLKLGAIYTINYLHWKKNPTRIYIFVLWGNPITPKVHALNLGARELSTIDRMKLVHTIVKLSKVPNANVYSGQLLYRVFSTYLKPQMKKCYRTYFHNGITRASLLNYGLNKETDFSDQDKKVYDPMMYQNAKRDYIITILNWYSRRGFDLKNVRESLARIPAKLPTQKEKEAQIKKDEELKKELTPEEKPEEKVEETKGATEEPKGPTEGGGGGELGGIGY